MSTNVATPSLRGCGRSFLNMCPSVRRWWARYMQLLCWMAARWGNLSRFSLDEGEEKAEATSYTFRWPLVGLVCDVIFNGNPLTCGMLARRHRRAGKCFSLWRRVAMHWKKQTEKQLFFTADHVMRFQSWQQLWAQDSGSLIIKTYHCVELPTTSPSVLRASSISCCTDSLMRQAGRHRLHGDIWLVFSICSLSCFTCASERAGSLGRRSLESGLI